MKKQVFIDRSVLKALSEECLTVKELSVVLGITESSTWGLLKRLANDPTFGITVESTKKEKRKRGGRKKVVLTIEMVREKSKECFTFGEMTTKLNCCQNVLDRFLKNTIDLESGKRLKDIIRQQLAWNRSMRNFEKHLQTLKRSK